MLLREYIRAFLNEQAHVLTLYHGTGLHNLPSILKDGLKAYRPRGAPHGQRGVYLTSNVELAARYAHGELSSNERPIVLEVRISKRKRTKKLAYDPLDRHDMWYEDGGYADDDNEIERQVRGGIVNLIKKLLGKDIGWGGSEYVEQILGTRYDIDPEKLDGVPLYQNAVQLLMELGVKDRRAAMKAVQQEWPPGEDWGDIAVSDSGTLQTTEQWYASREQLIYPTDLPPSVVKAVWVKCDQYELPPDAYDKTQTFGQEELPGEAKSRYEGRQRFLNRYYGVDWSEKTPAQMEDIADEAEDLQLDPVTDALRSGDINNIASEIENAADWIHDEWGEQQTTNVECWGRLSPQQAMQLG